VNNRFIAERLREAAGLLEQQGANRFRVIAYRRAAATVESLPEEVRSLIQTEGLQGLTSLPGIGRFLAMAIEEMVRTGNWSQLERLRGASDPESMLSRVPGIGSALAHRISERLQVDSLEALEVAAHDGRLGSIPGFGPRRVAMVRSALGEMLSRGRRRAPGKQPEPTIAVLLDVDREYRAKAHEQKLHLIAPRRFNPTNVAWLPILHTEREDWQFTAVFSNSALAHELGRVHDWVVVYFHTDSRSEGQRTVVTETQGALKGKRVVRGREEECRAYYDNLLPFESSNVA
jgi:putative hydrolase